MGSLQDHMDLPPQQRDFSYQYNGATGISKNWVYRWRTQDFHSMGAEIL